jgi:hypothetical protein
MHPRTATQVVASDHTSLQRWASELPRVSWPRSHLPAEVGSSTATCPMAPGSASLRGELRCYDVFLSSGPCLPIEVGSGAITWPWPRLPERRAPVLPRTPWPPASCVPQE